MLKTPLVSLFYGSETHVMEEEVQRIIDKSLQTQYKNFNITYFNAENCLPEEIISDANTLPFFDKVRVIVVTSFEKIQTDKSKRLLAYIKSPCLTTRLILTTGENIRKNNPILKELSKKGSARPFYTKKPHQAVSWLVKKVREDGWDIDADAAKLVVDKVGCETRLLVPEIEKLELYTFESRRISSGDVENLTSNIKTFTLFELCDAIGKREKEKALIILYKIFKQGEVPLVVLAMIIRQFRLIWYTKTLLKKNVAERDMIKKLGIPPFAFQPVKQQSKLFSDSDIKRVFRNLYKVDMSMKSGGGEKDLENFIFQFCSR